MKIRYEPLFKSFPALSGVKPWIPARDRELARESPPPALPLHCKPWLDASSHGLLLRFPYKATVTITDTGRHPPDIRISPASAERVYSRMAYSFAEDHFGLSSGYWLKTDPGVGTFTNHLPYGYPSKGILVPGLVETWRFPKNLFIVFKSPEPGGSITFEYEDPLCVLIPVVCEPVVGEPMSAEDIQEFQAQREHWHEYLAEHPELYWTAREGETFTHLYKVLGRRTDKAVSS
jgi:hypothetical protein